jgi:hypothetical protein
MCYVVNKVTVAVTLNVSYNSDDAYPEANIYNVASVAAAFGFVSVPIQFER